MAAVGVGERAARRPVRLEGLALVIVATMAIFAVLVVLGRADFLAYHSVVEFLVAAVGLTIFSIAWHTRHLGEDDYLTVLGIAQLFVAAMTMLHALTYNGMSVFPTATVTTASQFWIATRVLQVAGLMVAPAFVDHRLKRPSLMFIAFAVPSILAVYAVFWGAFPVTFVEGQGLTAFKIYAEWVIVAGMALGLGLLWRRRDRLQPSVFADLAAAIGCMIAAELLFMSYTTLYDLPSVVGHILHLASLVFIYRALVARSLEDPFSVLFRRLAQREDALREEHRLSEGLNHIVAAIGASLDSDDILDAAISEAAHVARADGATISVRDGERFCVRHAYGERLEGLLGQTVDRSQAPHLYLAAESGEPVVVADTLADPIGRQTMERFGTRALLSIPLVSQGKSTGVLSLHWQEPSPRTTSASLVLFARKLGAALSLALANARLYQDAHRVAETLQNAMVASVVAAADVEVGSVYRCAPGVGRIGGDFFDVFELGQGSVGFVLGDVAGKGIEAAATNALTRSTLRALAYRNPGLPAKVLAGANEALRRQLGPAEFVTAVFGVLDPSNGNVTLGLAGHPEPVVCGRPDHVPGEGVRNPPLGVVGGLTFDVWSFTLEPPDVLVLFSDGITEARDGTDLFGIERVRGVLERCGDMTCQGIADSVLAAVEGFSGGDLRDDVAVLALRPARQRSA